MAGASPLARGGNHIAAVGLAGKLYAIGGCSEQNANAFVDVSVYHPATDRWSSAAPLPQPLGSMGAVAVDGPVGGDGLCPEIRRGRGPVTRSARCRRSPDAARRRGRARRDVIDPLAAFGFEPVDPFERAAGQQAIACGHMVRVDTFVTKMVTNDKWSETWTYVVCDTQIAIPIDFVPSLQGGTDFTLRSKDVVVGPAPKQN